MLTSYILLAVLCVILLKYLRNFLTFRARMNTFPGSQDIHPLFGTLHHLFKVGFKEAGLKFFLENATKFKYFHRVWDGPFSCQLITYHPESVREVIKHSIKPRSTGLISTVYDMNIRWLGEGLILTNGPLWYRNRRLITPSFHFDILKSYIEVYNSCTNILIDNIKAQSQTGQSLDLQTLINKYSLDVILRCAFSLHSNCQSADEPNSYANTVWELQDLLMKRAVNPLHHVELIYRFSSNGRRFYHLCDVAHKAAEDIIAKRQKELENIPNKDSNSDHKCHDFLDTLLLVRDENNQGLAWKEIRNEVDTFLFAGHDTTASGIMWTLVNLAQMPHYQEQVFQEVKDVLGDRDVTHEDLAKLQFTGQCIKESLRKNAVVPVIGRKTTEEICINGHVIPKGTRATVQLYSLHNNPHIWEEPLKYNPERFSADNIAKMEPYQFIPFSAGARNCIGQNFAMNEMKLTISRVIRNFKLVADKDKSTTREMRITMRAAEGAFVYATPRN